MSSSSWSNGFGMKSSAPASIAFVFSGPIARRDHDHRQHRRLLALAEPPADGVAVRLRHHDVEQDEVRLRRLGELERGAGRRWRRRRRSRAAPSTASSRRTFSRDVVDDEDPGAAASLIELAPSQCASPWRRARRCRPASRGSRRSPAARNRSRSPSIACAVSASTGMRRGALVRPQPAERLDAVDVRAAGCPSARDRVACSVGELDRLLAGRRLERAVARRLRGRRGTASCSSRCPRRRGSARQPWLGRPRRAA